MALLVRRGARTQHDKLEKYIKLQRSLLGETVFTAVQFNSWDDRFASPWDEEKESEIKEQSCRIVYKDATLQRLHRHNDVGQWDHRCLDGELGFNSKLGLSSEIAPFSTSFSHFTPLFPSLLSLFPVFCVFTLFCIAPRAPSVSFRVSCLTLGSEWSVDWCHAGKWLELGGGPRRSCRACTHFCTQAGGNKGDEATAGRRTQWR